MVEKDCHSELAENVLSNRKYIEDRTQTPHVQLMLNIYLYETEKKIQLLPRNLAVLKISLLITSLYSG